ERWFFSPDRGRRRPGGKGLLSRSASGRDQGARAMSRLALLALMALALLLSACKQPSFTNQPKYKTFSAAPGWPNNQSERHPPPGTVARGEPLEPVPDKLPVALTHSLLKRGQQQFDIFCTPCHGFTGYGNGIV